jgi:hypothetical protein
LWDAKVHYSNNKRPTKYPGPAVSTLHFHTLLLYAIRFSNPERETGFFRFPKRPDQFWGPPSRLFNERRGSLSEVQWPGREVDSSRPCSADVKNERRYTSAPPICLHGMDTDSFTFIWLPSYMMLCPGPGATQRGRYASLTTGTQQVSDAHRCWYITALLNFCNNLSSDQKHKNTIQDTSCDTYRYFQTSVHLVARYQLKKFSPECNSVEHLNCSLCLVYGNHTGFCTLILWAGFVNLNICCHGPWTVVLWGCIKLRLSNTALVAIHRNCSWCIQQNTSTFPQTICAHTETSCKEIYNRIHTNILWNSEIQHEYPTNFVIWKKIE